MEIWGQTWSYIWDLQQVNDLSLCLKFSVECHNFRNSILIVSRLFYGLICTGQEITSIGDPLGPDSRLYVVQKGTIIVHKLHSNPEVVNSNLSNGSTPVSSNTVSHGSGWGSRLGCLLKSPSGGHTNQATPTSEAKLRSRLTNGAPAGPLTSLGSSQALPNIPQNGIENSAIGRKSRSPSLTSG